DGNTALVAQVGEGLGNALQVEELAGMGQEVRLNVRFGFIPRLRTSRGQHVIGIRVGGQIAACGGQHTAGRGGQSTRRALVRRAGGGRRDGAGGRTDDCTSGKGSGNSTAQRRSQDSHLFVPQLSLRWRLACPLNSANVQPTSVARRRI